MVVRRRVHRTFSQLSVIEEHLASHSILSLLTHAVTGVATSVRCTVCMHCQKAARIARLASKCVRALRSYVGALLGGTSQLHLKPDGSAAAPPPAEDVVKDEVVRAAVAENLVTPHTASVGVLLQSNPMDASLTEKHEVPLQVWLWRGTRCESLY